MVHYSLSAPRYVFCHGRRRRCDGDVYATYRTIKPPVRLPPLKPPSPSSHHHFPSVKSTPSVNSLRLAYNINTMRSTIIVALSAALPRAMACLGYEDGLPAHTGEKSLSEPQYIGAGEIFDAGWVKYDRGVACGGQGEGGILSTPTYTLRIIG